MKFEEKDVFIQEICEHFCVSKCIEELQDVVTGMKVLGFFDVFIQHYDELKQELLACNESKAEEFLKIFNPDYSGDSSLREKQEDIYYNFTNFVETIEQEPFKFTDAVQLDDEIEIKSEKLIKMSDVIQFCTGSKYVMPAMIGNGKISFIEPGDICFGRRVTVQTCTLSVVFPLSERYYISTNRFMESFSEDIATGTGFGIPWLTAYL